MRIVVNAALLPDIYSSEYISFLSETFARITRNHPEHNFIFICETKDADLFSFEKNTGFVKTKVSRRNAITWKYWYDVRIPALLRKYKADLFISPGLFCSLHTKLPQLLMSADLVFVDSPSFFSKSQLFFFRKHARKSITKAKRIITFTQFTKEEIKKNYIDTESKIDVIPVPVWVRPNSRSDSIKDQTKAKYTEGKEFFLYTGNSHASGNLINLMKAFSLFKKRQQSSFKLVICGDQLNQYKAFTKLIETYKYKADVSLINSSGEEELSNLMVSAYAFVYPVLSNGLALPLIQAMQSDIPVVISDNRALKQIAEDAALYVNPADPQNIADNMMRIYKDEKLRNDLIIKGNGIVNRLMQYDTGDQLWQAMQKALL